VSSFLKNWLPVLLWCALIFGASGDKSSGERSSRVIAPIVRFFAPSISKEALDRIVHYARKTAHVTEYAILALVLWRALHQSRARRAEEDLTLPPGSRAERSPWSWRIAALALGLAVLYAATDEFHQSFIPSRTAEVRDVFIDAFGAALGLFAFWIVGRWRKHW
jgi:VanZ family protein